MKIITKTLFTLILLLTLLNCSSDDGSDSNLENEIQSNENRLVFQHISDKKREFLFFNIEKTPDSDISTMVSDMKYMYDGELICDGIARFTESDIAIIFKTINCHTHEKYLFNTTVVVTAEFSENFMRTNSALEDQRHTFVNKDYIPSTD